jgi:hypothetical protein
VVRALGIRAKRGNRRSHGSTFALTLAAPAPARMEQTAVVPPPVHRRIGLRIVIPNPLQPIILCQAIVLPDTVSREPVMVIAAQGPARTPPFIPVPILALPVVLANRASCLHLKGSLPPTRTPLTSQHQLRAEPSARAEHAHVRTYIHTHTERGRTEKGCMHVGCESGSEDWLQGVWRPVVGDLKVSRWGVISCPITPTLVVVVLSLPRPTPTKIRVTSYTFSEHELSSL